MGVCAYASMILRMHGCMYSVSLCEVCVCVLLVVVVLSFSGHLFKWHS